MSRKTLSTPQAPISRRAPVGPKNGRLLKAPRSAATAESRVLGAFKVVEAPQVRAFLAEHPFLLPMLREAPAQIERHFPGADLRLELRPDWDTSGPPTLFLYIETAPDVDAALDGLDAVYRDWWFSCVPDAQRKMAVSIDFP